MAVSSINRNYLHVAIYFGGELIGQSIKPYRKRQAVSAGRSFFCNIKSPIWPKWDNLDILIRNPSGLFLNPTVPWDGVISDGTSTKILNSTSGQKSIFEITAQTTASLRLENLSVAIKVGPKLPTYSQIDRKLVGYSDHFLKFFAENSLEWTSLSIGLVASGILCISSWIALKNRPFDLPETINGLPGEVLLPFISQRHLSEAPHVIQFGLDRFNYIHSVWNYYSSLSKIIGFGVEDYRNHQIFETTALEYSSLKSDQNNFFLAATQEKSKQNSKALGIPSIKGETIEGKVQRVLDKISVISSNAKNLSELRSTVAGDFLKDIGYKYEEQKNQSATNEAYGKISAGFLGLDSDDDMQKSQAKNAAARAALVQLGLFGDTRLRSGTIKCCISPIGTPVGLSVIDWTESKIRFTETIDLSAVKASTWGAPTNRIERIKEPKNGHLEPKSIETAVNAGRHQLRLCYEMALRRNETAVGTMEWSWTIDSRGQIGQLGLIQSSIKDNELIQCIHDKISKWIFPKPVGGSVQVRYPFEFSRDKG